MTGVFSKMCGWIATGIKVVGKVCNLGKKSALFIWWDGKQLKFIGSPELVKKLETSLRCQECCQFGSYEEAAKKDMIDLSTGAVTVEVDHTLSNNKILQDMVNKDDVLKLPAPIELMNTKESKQWLDVELKKDYIEQGLKPVAEIPWGKLTYKPSCWPDSWPWPTVSNPVRKPTIAPPLNGLTKNEVFKQAIRNRAKGKYD